MIVSQNSGTWLPWWHCAVTAPVLRLQHRRSSAELKNLDSRRGRATGDGERVAKAIDNSAGRSCAGGREGARGAPAETSDSHDGEAAGETSRCKRQRHELAQDSTTRKCNQDLY
jgi:hypothetical protein